MCVMGGIDRDRGGQVKLLSFDLRESEWGVCDQWDIQFKADYEQRLPECKMGNVAFIQSASVNYQHMYVQLYVVYAKLKITLQPALILFRVRASKYAAFWYKNAPWRASDLCNDTAWP